MNVCQCDSLVVHKNVRSQFREEYDYDSMGTVRKFFKSKKLKEKFSSVREGLVFTLEELWHESG